MIQKLVALTHKTETSLAEFQRATLQLVANTSHLLQFKHLMVEKDPYLLRVALTGGLIEVLRAYQALEIDCPPDTAEMWGDNTRPGIDMICAKLVRYSSNLYAMAYSSPDTVLESNMDYDLRQYLMFMHAFGEHYGVNLMEGVQPVKD